MLEDLGMPSPPPPKGAKSKISIGVVLVAGFVVWKHLRSHRCLFTSLTLPWLHRSRLVRNYEFLLLIAA